MSKAFSASERDTPNEEIAMNLPEPPAVARYFFTSSLNAIVYFQNASMSDPKVCARFAVGKIHVEHIGLGDSFEPIGQFSRAVGRAKPLAVLPTYLICFIEASHIFPRHPQP